MKLRIGVITDLHYAHEADPLHCDLKGERSLLLLAEVLRQNRVTGKEPDVYLLLGDTLQEPDCPDAGKLLMEIRETFEATDVPMRFVAGNHDPSYPEMERVFGKQEPYFEAGNRRIVLFNDTQIAEGCGAFREEREFELMRQAAVGFHGRLIAAQHVPLNPTARVCRSKYAYRNADEIAGEMKKLGYLLSISGHDHCGETAYQWQGVTFVTAPALALPPFRWLSVEIDDSDRIQIETGMLRNDF